MKQNSLKDAQAFKQANQALLIGLQKEAEAIPCVVYSDVWLNGNCPSFVAGFDSEDQQIVSLPIEVGAQSVKQEGINRIAQF